MHVLEGQLEWRNTCKTLGAWTMRIAYLTEAGAKIQGTPACIKWDTQAKYISEKKKYISEREIAQSGEGRNEAKERKVCQ